MLISLKLVILTIYLEKASKPATKSSALSVERKIFSSDLSLDGQALVRIVSKKFCGVPRSLEYGINTDLNLAFNLRKDMKNSMKHFYICYGLPIFIKPKALKLFNSTHFWKHTVPTFSIYALF